jgi:predicted dithiol-disulfide oxidoreductase (DUF899 family)
VDKPYVFDTREGEKSLAELFGDKSQLIVYRFTAAENRVSKATG